MEMLLAVPLHSAKFVLYAIQKVQINLQELHAYYKAWYSAF